MKAINEQIKYHRIARGLNQPQLGKLINKSKGYISAIESGRIFPSHKTLIEIADALECDLVLAEKNPSQSHAGEVAPTGGVQRP